MSATRPVCIVRSAYGLRKHMQFTKATLSDSAEMGRHVPLQQSLTLPAVSAHDNIPEWRAVLRSKDPCLKTWGKMIGPWGASALPI